MCDAGVAASAARAPGAPSQASLAIGGLATLMALAVATALGKVAPGFLTDLRMDKGDRLLTFFDGTVARERLVTLDDEHCRLVYAVVDGRPSHYNAAVQVFPEGDTSRVVWTIDILPDALAPAVSGMMDEAIKAMGNALAS